MKQTLEDDINTKASKNQLQNFVEKTALKTQFDTMMAARHHSPPGFGTASAFFGASAAGTAAAEIAAMQPFNRFRPIADRILVQKLKADVKSAGGILLPDVAKLEVNQAKVLVVGAGRRNKDGKLLPMATKVGDTIIIPRYGGTEIELEEEVYHIFRDEDIVGIIKPE